MLYKYEFIRNRKTNELNQHFLFFIRKIRKVKKSASFNPKLYFHKTFLNDAGKIAPKGVINKAMNTKFKEFFDSFKRIDISKKDEFYKLIVFSNDIHDYFENELITDVINLRNGNIKSIIGNDSFKSLMEELWKYLKSPNAWEIDELYDNFYDNLPKTKVCPFCGLDKISNRDLFKSDFDHIANKADYPISSINLKNLAPTCSDCNQKFKKAEDVFFDDNDDRIKFMYPYVFNRKYEALSLSLDFSESIIPNTDLTNISGEWKMKIIPDDSFTAHWDFTYKIKKRYIDAIKHESWTDELTHIMKINNVKLTNNQEVKDYINKYKEAFNPTKIEVEYHLKYYYFNYLALSENDIYYKQIIEKIA